MLSRDCKGPKMPNAMVLSSKAKIGNGNGGDESVVPTVPIHCQ
jgi:hypothetical protein